MKPTRPRAVRQIGQGGRLGRQKEKKFSELTMIFRDNLAKCE